MATDPMSRLPVSILHHILFFLPAKDAARTSTLSKSWLRLWKSVRSSSFDLNEGDFMENLDQSEQTLTKEQRREKFARFVDGALRVLHREKVVIGRFKLKVTLSDTETASQIEEWIALVARNPVSEFHLQFECYIYSELHRQMFWTLLSITSLTKLELTSCKIFTSMLKGEMQFPCLKEMSLDYVEFDDEDVPQKLVDASPSLEKFFIFCLGSFTRLYLDLMNHPSLETIVAEYVCEIRLEAPNLESLDWCGVAFEPRRCTLSGLKTLSLYFYGYPTITNNLINDIFEECQLLETLELGPIKGNNIMIENDQLKSLKLTSEAIRETKIDISAPSLLSFTYTGKVIPSFSWIPCPSIQEIVLELTLDSVVDTNWFKNFRIQFAKFQDCKLLRITIRATRFEFSHDIMRSISVPPRPNVQFLDLDVDVLSENYELNLSELLKGLFWCFKPQNLSVPFHYWNLSTSMKFVKLLFEVLKTIEQEPPQCCQNDDDKCWKHHLRGFGVVQTLPLFKDVKALSSDALLELFNPNTELQFQLKW